MRPRPVRVSTRSTSGTSSSPPAELDEAECEYAEGAQPAAREATAFMQAGDVEVIMLGAVLGKIVTKGAINEVTSKQRRLASTTTPALATLLAFLTGLRTSTCTPLSLLLHTA